MARGRISQPSDSYDSSDSAGDQGQSSQRVSSGQSTVSSGLSSVPSSMFTPAVGSNPAERDSSPDNIPAVFLAKKKVRTSHVWLPENGEEVAIDGQPRWKCNRCTYFLLSF
jgi:hypothetical protein